MYQNIFLTPFKVTEKEIELGILENNENSESHALYFERKLKNIENITDKNIKSKFMDLDEESEVLLEALKTKVKKKLPRSNVFQFDVIKSKGQHALKLNTSA